MRVEESSISRGAALIDAFVRGAGEEGAKTEEFPKRGRLVCGVGHFRCFKPGVKDSVGAVCDEGDGGIDGVKGAEGEV